MALFDEVLNNIWYLYYKMYTVLHKSQCKSSNGFGQVNYLQMYLSVSNPTETYMFEFIVLDFLMNNC